MIPFPYCLVQDSLFILWGGPFQLSPSPWHHKTHSGCTIGTQNPVQLLHAIRPWPSHSLSALSVSRDFSHCSLMLPHSQNRTTKVLEHLGTLWLREHSLNLSPPWALPSSSPQGPDKPYLTLCIWLELLTAPGTALSSPRSPVGLTPSSSTYPSVIQPSP